MERDTSPTPQTGSPEHYRRLARTTFRTAPLGLPLGFGLAAVQGAEMWVAALCGTLLFVGTLMAAALISLRGSKAGEDAAWLALILRLLARR